MYYIYMLRCKDNSIYTGITTELERRMNEHFKKSEKCAKYTSSHIAKKLEKVWTTENKSLASKLEYYIKRLSKYKKESLVNGECDLEDLLSDKIDVNLYMSKNI